MNHLTPDELIDAVEGTLDPALRTHLTRCAACGEEAARLHAILQEAKAIDIPEPSPLFWDHFSTRVRAAIETEQAPERSWLPDWLRWQVLAPVAALALLVAALSVSMPRAPEPVPVPEIAAADPAAAVEDLAMMGVEEWAVVSAIVGTVEFDQAREAGIAVKPGDAERIALQLNAAEQQELVRLIKEEMQKAGD
jgi:hypothetical protein